MFCHLGSLIYTHVIHVHSLWENSYLVWIPRPSATYRNIHDNEELMVENPRIWHIGWREFEEFLIVEKPAKFILPIKQIFYRVVQHCVNCIVRQNPNIQFS